MELERQQQLLTRWLDSELEGDELREFEAAVSDPQLREAKSEADQLRRLLRADMPERDIPNPDFFHSQIQRRIAADATKPASATAPASGSIFSWFRSPFTLASAAAVLLLGMFVLSKGPATDIPAGHTSVASTYTPDKTIVATLSYSDEADATVIMLDGLAALPDSTELKGQNIVSSEHGSPSQLYNEHNQLAFVIIQGAGSVPVLRSLF